MPKNSNAKLPDRRKSYVSATKTRATSRNEYLPGTVVVLVTGERAGKLLMVQGWTTPPPGKLDLWPAYRLEQQLARITAEWHEEHGKSWKLEIRDAEAADEARTELTRAGLL